MPSGVSLHTTRLPLTGSGSSQLLSMASEVEQGALLLKDTQPNLIVFHCTAVSTWEPEMDSRLCERIERATGIPAITTAKSLISAFKNFRAKKIVLLSPYIDEINRREINFLAHHQIEVLEFHGLGIQGPQEMHAVAPEVWLDLARTARRDDADAYFLSCTAIRSIEVVDELERELGRPVLTSNQTMAWHALRNVGVDEKITGAGKLFTI
ncbi:hypothetical protein AYM40_21290 [Paraburkholderia phytofirmans OLGA172]|uniref:Arylmalonate decarboxylase n=2 Tax=Paraburkholderia phytofirmans TaxID=261302 RepID=A0A160FVL5_9BURK|nr:hypothetical protein AYM40_21290 [Paraburkholderia phytofirmans OLGA172]